MFVFENRKAKSKNLKRILYTKPTVGLASGGGWVSFKKEYKDNLLSIGVGGMA